MKVLVCGGRDYSNVDKVYEVLDEIDQREATLPGDKTGEIITAIISGHAKGADSIGEMYGDERGFRVEVYPANWNLYGRRAGYLRNVEMAEKGKPDLVEAFPGGKGTAMMIKIGNERGIEVMEVSDDISNSHS